MIKQRLTRIIIVLLAVQVALAAYFYTDHTTNQAQAQRAWRLDPDTIETIEVTTSTFEYRFIKQSDRWFTVQNNEQSTTPANTDRVSAILSLLSAPENGGYNSDDVNLDATGLSSPTATVTLGDYRVTFGSATDDQQQRYIRIQDRVYLINELVFPLINTGPAAFNLPQ